MIVLIGKRLGALKAARRLGLDVVLCDSREPGRKTRGLIRGYYPLDYGGTFREWENIGQQIAREGAVDAVIGLVERAVLPAACMRGALNTGGVRPAQARAFVDKVVMKKTVAGGGVPCAEFVPDTEKATPAELIARLGLPMVVKTRIGSGGRGALRIDREADVPRGLAPGWMAEKFIAGTEMSVESFVCAGEVVFVNCTEYLEPRWANIIPASLSPGVKAQVEAMNRAVVRSLSLDRGMTHMELFLMESGPVFGEIAVRPPGGHIMEAIAESYGFDPWEAQLRLETGLPLSDLGAARQYTGVRIIHPGAGTVACVSGLDAARSIPGVVKIHCTARPGSAVAPRLGCGVEVGYIMARGANREAAVRSIQEAAALLKIQLDAGPGTD